MLKGAVKRKTLKRAEDLARGSISVLLVIVLVPIVSVAGLFVDASRYQLARSEVAAAADLTLNTALADYDSVLKKVYGLFAVSQSDDELQSNLRSYFTEMMVDAGVATDSLSAEDSLLLSNILDATTGETSNLLALTMNDEDDGQGVTFSGVSGSSLAKADVLKNQIVEYNKYRTPVNAAFSVLDGIKAISKTSKQMKVTKKQADVDEALEDLNKACKSLYKKAKEYQDIDKAILSSVDRVNGSTYRSHYQNTIVPAAIQKVIIPSEPAAIAERVSSNNTGYNVRCSISDFTPTTEVATDTSGRKIGVGSAVRNLDEDALLEECDAIAKRIEGNRGLSVLDQERFADLSLNDKQTYAQTYNRYMEDVYRLWRFYDAYIGKLPTDERKDYKDGDGKRYGDLLSVAVDRSSRFDWALQEVESSFAEAEDATWAVYNDYATKLSVLDNMSSTLDECISKASAIKKKLEEVNSKNESFGASLSNYTSSGSDSFSAQMESAYEANKEILDTENFEKFRAKLESLKAQADKEREHYRAYEFMGKGLGSYRALDNVVSQFSYYSISNGPSIYEYLTNEATKPFGELVGDVMRAFSSPDEVGTINYSIEDDPFYKYLKLTFAQDEKSSEDEKTLKNLTNTAENGASDATKTSGLSGDSIGEMLGDSMPSKGGSDKGAESADAGGMSKDGYSGMLNNMSSIVEDLTSGIGSALVAARDNLYVMDYAFSMFSWYTQEKEYAKDDSRSDKDPKTPSGIAINETNNKIYKAEVEYVLYGKDTASLNVSTSMASIFAIRFACNSIHALTDSEINSVTLGPAFAIQAASGGVIPYKIPQVVMKLALALAESGIDMKKMCDGEAVPLLKNDSTFAMKPSNALNAAKDAAIDLASDAISKSGDKLKGTLNSLLDSAADQASTSASGLVNQIGLTAAEQANQAVDSLFGAFSTSVQLSVSRLTTSLSEAADSAADRIVDDAIEAARSYVSQQGSGAVREALESAFATYIEGNKGSLKATVSGKVSQLQTAADGKASEIIESAQTEIKNKISGWTSSAQDYVNGKISSAVSGLKDSVSSKLSGGIDKATSEVKQGVANEINDWFDSNFGGYTGSVGASSSSGSVSAGSASLLEFKYSDYLKMFLYIKLCVNPDKYVTRIADLIELNIKTAGADSDLLHARGSDFSMSEAFTYYQMDASLGLETMFLDMPLVTRRMGVESVSSFPVEYKGAQGY